jgi:type IV pilus assembly protein PilA
MIVVAIIAVILALALPVYSNYTIRAKIDGALSDATAAKSAVSASCIENPDMTTIDSVNTGYRFTKPTRYVASIALSGPCTRPLISIQTQQTGAIPDPVINLLGQMDRGRLQFACSTAASNVLVPKDCRS